MIQTIDEFKKTYFPEAYYIEKLTKTADPAELGKYMARRGLVRFRKMLNLGGADKDVL